MKRFLVVTLYFMVEVPGIETTVTFYRVPVAEFWRVAS